ncbi:MAG: YhfC family intramembrane metalloprotease, partial [Alcaligenaceae bacterium]|nr:YhfC family intramembrane metalloprotease [Alcaligenaceae bacterium]
LALLERVLAIILHVNLTVLDWNGFQIQRIALYLLIAIGIHGFVNSLIPIISSFSNSILLIEGAFAAVNIILVSYSYSSRKYYA